MWYDIEIWRGIVIRYSIVMWCGIVIRRSIGMLCGIVIRRGIVMLCGIQAKAFTISESEKFRQLLFFILYHHFQLPLEFRGWVFLDLFDALNPPVASVCP